MTPCPLFVELCAGTAAMSLRLHRARARPPVSRMGAKTGYADVLLGLMGLAPGQGTRDGTRYLWSEPDPGVRLLLEAYRDAGLARAAADIIRGWAGEDPRALWERLRAEGPPRGAEAGEVARWCTLAQSAYRRGDPDSGFDDVAARAGVSRGACLRPVETISERWVGVTLPAEVYPDARAVEPREVARWVWTWGRSYNTKGPDAGFLPSESSKGTPVWNAHPPEHFAAATASLPCLPADMVPDAREVDPREVARWAVTGRWSVLTGVRASGYAGPDVWSNPDAASIARAFGGTPTLPADIAPDARTIDPGPCLPSGTWAFIDPPYQGTTGYGHDLPRSEVVALARRWAEAGAGVMVTEAEAIPELVAEGWHAVEYDHGRVGQRRTFSKQQREVATMNRAPGRVDRLGVPLDLFGGGK